MIQIRLIDNTLNDDMDGVYQKGTTEIQPRQTIPNMAKITATGEEVFYNHAGLIRAGDKYFVDPNNVFIKDDCLIKPGLLLKRHNVEQIMSGLMVFNEQEFFKVVSSNMDGVSDGAMVIVRQDTTVKFNYGYRLVYWALPQHVFLVVDPSGIHPGPNFELLDDPIIVENSAFMIDGKTSTYGYKNGRKMWFTFADYDVTIKGQHKLIVDKKNLKVKEVGDSGLIE